MQAGYTDGGTTMKTDTVVISAQATRELPAASDPDHGLSGRSTPGQTVSGNTTTVIGFGATLRLNVIMDLRPLR